ncbi:hypothetical protein HNY73_013045 [Argiope bruennichi]|uniref:Uncharacterized protein n=1 Tax=Argiope bruennichi TaxID=94029 RepID=A0A8T0EYY2_ARGBR|nr:hypothetical protein HNY73_013045 [Argiope bruennichi]
MLLHFLLRLTDSRFDHLSGSRISPDVGNLSPELATLLGEVGSPPPTGIIFRIRFPGKRQDSFTRVSGAHSARVNSSGGEICPLKLR